MGSISVGDDVSKTLFEVSDSALEHPTQVPSCDARPQRLWLFLRPAGEVQRSRVEESRTPGELGVDGCEGRKSDGLDQRIRAAAEEGDEALAARGVRRGLGVEGGQCEARYPLALGHLGAEPGEQLVHLQSADAEAWHDQEHELDVGARERKRGVALASNLRELTLVEKVSDDGYLDAISLQRRGSPRAQIEREYDLGDVALGEAHGLSLELPQVDLVRVHDAPSPRPECASSRAICHLVRGRRRH